jgi:hypothetical protein
MVPNMIRDEVVHKFKQILVRVAAGATLMASLGVSACMQPSASIKAGDFSEADTAYYLILSDQLQRVRNVQEATARGGQDSATTLRACVGVMPYGPGVIEPVDPTIVDRLRSEQANEPIKLDVVSSFECLAYYTRDVDPMTAEHSDTLSFAGVGNLSVFRNDEGCGAWFGGGDDRGAVEYNVEVEDGVATLTGGRACAAHSYWVRT